MFNNCHLTHLIALKLVSLLFVVLMLLPGSGLVGPDEGKAGGSISDEAEVGTTPMANDSKTREAEPGIMTTYHKRPEAKDASSISAERPAGTFRPSCVEDVSFEQMNHPQMPTYVPMHQQMHLHPQKPETGFLRMDLWVSSSVLADRTAPLHLSEASFLKTKQESASPLPRRELAPEGAATPKVLRSVNGHPPPNGGGPRRGFLRMEPQKFEPIELLEPLQPLGMERYDKIELLVTTELTEPLVSRIEHLPILSKLSLPPSTQRRDNRADRIIMNHTYVNDTEMNMSQSIVIRNGGNLSLDNVTIKFNCANDGQYYIDVQAGGVLWANGSHFTVVNKNFEYDWWFRAGSFGRLSDCIIEECGYDGPGSMGVLIETNDLAILNCTVRNSYKALWCNPGSPRISGNHIYHNYRGVQTSNHAAPCIEDNIMENNTMSGVACFSSSSPLIHSNIFHNSGQYEIYCTGSSPTITHNEIRTIIWRGIECQDGSDAVIRNNTVTGVENLTEAGITCFSCTPEIIDNRIITNRYGIICQDAASPLIRGNTIRNSYWNGTSEQVGRGICTWFSSSPDIIDNVISNNDRGIECLDSSNPTIEDNVISNNSEFGITCIASSPDIVDNIIRDNDCGVVCADSSTPVVKNNVISNNERGVVCIDSSDARIENNTISLNRQQGIFCDGASPFIFNNRLSYNKNGTWLQIGSDSRMENNTFTYNTYCGVLSHMASPFITNNVLSNNGWDGVTSRFSRGIRVRNNTISQNSGAGIFCTSSSAEITGNTISNNQKGMECHNTNSTILSDNIISGNGRVAIQCYSASLTIINSTIIRSQDLCFLLDANSHLFLINSIFQESKVHIEDQDSDLEVKWFINIGVTFINGSAALGSNIEVKDVSGNPVHLTSSENPGPVRYLVCTEYVKVYDPREGMFKKRYYTPYDISASMEEHVGYLEGLMFSENANIVIILDNEPPEGIISSPNDGASFLDSDVIIFNASLSTDMEGDALHFTWYSNIDGLLYSGSEATMCASLSGGHHLITLVLSDNFGASFSCQEKVMVFGRENVELSSTEARMEGVAGCGGEGKIDVKPVGDYPEPLVNSIREHVKIYLYNEMLFDSLLIEFQYTEEETKEFDENTLELYYWNEKTDDWKPCHNDVLDGKELKVTLFEKYNYQTREIDGTIVPVRSPKEYSFREDNILDNLLRNGEITICLVAKTRNSPPVALAHCSDDLVKAGTLVQFNAEGSFDPDGNELEYWWDLDANIDSDTDGIKINDKDAIGSSITYAFRRSGIYFITLNVYDGYETAYDRVKLIATINSRPIPVIESNSLVFIGQSLQLNASNSYDLDGDELYFSWEFSDGGTDEGCIVFHRFRSVGRFYANLTVSDGSLASVDRVSIEVKEREVEEGMEIKEEKSDSGFQKYRYIWTCIVSATLILCVLFFFIKVYKLTGNGHKGRSKMFVLFLFITIISTFATPGLSLSSGETPSETSMDENEHIITENQTWHNEEKDMIGNLTIEKNTHLLLDNTVLRFHSEAKGKIGITVKNGGTLTVRNGSIITAGALDESYFFRFEPGSKGLLINSAIGECGDSMDWGLTVMDDDVLIKGCLIKNNTVGVSSWEASPVVMNNLISNCKVGITLSGSFNHCSPLISGNIISNNTMGGVHIYGRFMKPTLSGNVITHNGDPNNNRCSVECFGNCRPIFVNNEISDNSGSIECSFAFPTFINSTISNNIGVDFDLSVHSQVVLINTSFDRDKCLLSDSTIIIRNFIDITCVDAFDQPIPNVFVTITDQHTLRSDSFFTDAKGGIPRMNCTAAVMDDDGIRSMDVAIETAKNGVVNNTSMRPDDSKEFIVQLIQSSRKMPEVTLREDTPKYAAWDLKSYFFDIKYGPEDIDFYHTQNEYIDVGINNDHTVDLFPVNDWHGTQEIEFTAVNPDGNAIRTSVLVTVEGTDDEPIIDLPENIIVLENETLEITLNATDRDGETLWFTYSEFLLDKTYTNQFYNASNFTIQWQTGFYDAGHYELKITAYDGNSTFSSVVNITVLDVNRPPPAMIDSPETCVQGDTILFLAYDPKGQESSYDPDGDELTYLWDIENCMVQLIGSTMIYTFEKAGVYNISLTVSDGIANTTISKQITVKALYIEDSMENESEIVSGSVFLKLNCSDEVTSVEYYLGLEKLYEDKTPPFEYTLNVSKYPNGLYMLLIKVHYPSEGNETDVRYIIKNVMIKNDPIEGPPISSLGLERASPVTAAASISIFVLVFIRLKDFSMQYFEEFGKRGEMSGKKKKSHRKKGIQHYAIRIAGMIGTWLNKLERKQEYPDLDGGTPQKESFFPRNMIPTMLLSIFLIGTGFSIVEASSERNIFAFEFHRFFVALPVSFITIGVVVVFSDFIELLTARLNHIRSNFQVWRLGTILMFFSAIVLMAPFGLPAKVSNVISKPISKKSEAMMAIAKTMSIALFLIPFYFILTYASDGSYLHLAGKMGASVALMLYVYTMFPLWPFEGYDVYKWNKGAWGGCFGLGLGMFLLHSFEILPVGFLSLFGCIGLILFEFSMFWLYRQFKKTEIADMDTPGEEEESDSEPPAEIVDILPLEPLRPSTGVIVRKKVRKRLEHIDGISSPGDEDGRSENKEKNMLE